MLQIFILLFGSASAAAPIIMVVIITVIGLWISGILSLSKRFDILTKEPTEIPISDKKSLVKEREKATASKSNN